MVGVKAIFLDFDGTIAEARDIAVGSMTKALEHYNYFVSWDKREQYMGYPIHMMMKDLGYNDSDALKVQKKFYYFFKKGVREGKSKLCCPMKPLWELKKKYPLVIISNSKTDYLKLSIRKFRLKGLFNKVYGKDKFESKDQMITKLCKKYKISPKEVLFVGDNFSDVRYAKLAKCVSVAISNPHAWSSLKKLKKESPDYIIKNFSELKKLVEKINLKK